MPASATKYKQSKNIILRSHGSRPSSVPILKLFVSCWSEIRFIDLFTVHVAVAQKRLGREPEGQSLSARDTADQTLGRALNKTQTALRKYATLEWLWSDKHFKSSIETINIVFLEREGYTVWTTDIVSKFVKFLVREWVGGCTMTIVSLVLSL